EVVAAACDRGAPPLIALGRRDRSTTAASEGSRIVETNVGDRRRVLLEALPQLGRELAKRLGREGNAHRLEHGGSVDGTAQDIEHLTALRPKMSGDRVPKMDLYGEPALPTLLGHETIDGWLEL